MDLTKKIIALLSKGMSREDIVLHIATEDETISNEDAIKAYKSAEKSFSIEKSMLETDEKEAEEKKIEEKATVLAEALAEKALKKIKIPSAIDPEKKSSQVKVVENDLQWKVNFGRAVQLIHYNKENPGNEDVRKELGELSEKARNSYKSMGLSIPTNTKVPGIVTDTDTEGGFLVEPKFDMEMDKLVFAASELIAAITIRRGNDKTLIDSISTFDFAFRADQNAAFGEAKPTFNQEEVNYREAGAIVPISTAAMNGTPFNLTSEIMEGAVDAKIRLLEPLIATGDSSDPFLGFRFHAGITDSPIIDTGTGVLSSKDLTNAYLACPTQSRRQGSFVLDTREFCLLAEERDNQNLPIETVVNINGKFIHKKTGLPIIISDLMSRTNLAFTNNSGGTDVGAFFAVLPRFRYYEDGGMRIDTSKEHFFAEDQIGMRFIIRMKFAIPLQSRSSFVTLSGVKNNPIS